LAYTIPTDPPASDVVVTFSGGALTTMLRFADAVCLVGDSLSVTVTVKLTVPVKVPVGVPEIAPVLAFKDRPAGRLPVVIDHVYGVMPPAAAKVAPG
jgi:hypothetical protein